MSEPLATRPRVLIVDDEFSARLIMRATLEEAGFEVEEAGTVCEALQHFHARTPDLIILDVLLPDGNGIALCATLRQLPQGHTLPIAMATGLDDIHSIQQAFQSGATDFITKPISWGTLGYRVHYLLRAHQAFEELAISEAKNRALLSALPDLLFLIRDDGLIVDRLAGTEAPDWAEWDLHPGELLDNHPSAVVAQMLRLEIANVLGNQNPKAVEIALPRNTLGVCWEARILPRSEHEVLLVLRDISLRKQMENQLRLSARVFESSNEAIMITDSRNRIISVNPTFEAITGYRESEVLGQEPRLLGAGQETRSLYRNLWALLYENGAWQGELVDQRKNGDEYPVWISISLVRDGNGDPEYHIASFADITDRKRQEAQIEHLAFHDVLTGLPNRRLLTDRIQVAISQAQRDNDGLALLFIDLDRFKTINDSLGHQIGDQLLREVGYRLSRWVRSGDTVSRVGGDEFIVLCPGCSSMEDAALLGEKLLEALGEPYEFDGKQLVITASIGIALYPNNGTDANALIGNADAAMYLAKENDRNNCQFYSPDLNARNLERLQMELRLRQALENQEFVLFFQPQIDARSGQLIGAETLIRWQDPLHGLIPPGRFIPLAEETGLIQAIGDWVLTAACEHQARWERLGLPPLTLAVNLSARQFRQPNFVEHLIDTADRSGIDPARLELELTESMLMKDIPQTTGKLQQLKARGFRMSVDDFGTGFSSLNYLRHFPLDVLKIDQSFVRELFEDEAALAIIDSIIALARALGMRTVAEGVETAPQRQILQSHGCDTLQGYLIAKPLPEAEFLAWRQSYQPASRNKGPDSE
ncbi:EAL domain-containing protein [Pseudaeromonas sharmana]|uniref:EAL domain-containing protein n=1 Tax=Pseudaeromonas sharmana TaxID=328412 RepID=A0ABV8CN29_9GAMM